MPKITRISTTVTARYSPANGAADSFWLDGRMPGTRDSRAADITLDREDRGFLFATFATQVSSKDSYNDVQAIKPVLEKTHFEIKHSSKNIDNQIPDLAECSVGVAGRVSVQHEGVRQPFFAGIVVKDSEIAAVTTGRGCAYLYRNETLFPLTKDDLEFDPVDYRGNKVPNLDIYCAGVAGTVRYSHIAQLQVDDCIILCNKEVIDAIGQKELLQILNDAYDQSDAAGMVITAGASKAPGTPMQFMIGFVEGIKEGDRTVKTLPYAMPIKTPTRPIFQKSSVDAKEELKEDSFDEEYEDEIYAEDEIYDEDEYYDEEPGADPKKIALVAIIAVILVIGGIVIYSLLNRDDTQDPDATPNPTVGETLEPTEDPEPTENLEPTEAPEPTEEPEPTSGEQGDILGTYVIQSGDSLYDIAAQYYGQATQENMLAIVDENLDNYPSMTFSYYVIGWELDIPKLD